MGELTEGGCGQFRASTRGAQTGLGIRSPQTKVIYNKFTAGKARAEEMVKYLCDSVDQLVLRSIHTKTSRSGKMESFQSGRFLF